MTYVAIKKKPTQISYELGLFTIYKKVHKKIP